MIYSSRRTHLYAIVGLTAVIPAILILSVIARRDFPKVAALPEEAPLSSIPTQFDYLKDVTLHVRFERTAKQRERLLLWVKPAETFVEPDVLLYWDAADPRSSGLSRDAALLGGLKGTLLRRLIVPPGVPEASGYLVVYSLGDNKVLGVTPWTVGGAQ